VFSQFVVLSTPRHAIVCHLHRMSAALRAASPVARPSRVGVRSRRRTHAVTRAATTTDADSPPYQVAAREDLYELRIYGGHYVCRAPYSNREKGLAALMSYIEGGNEETKTFPATQPLIMRYTCTPGTEDVAGKTMELSLGAGVTDPPASVDPTNVGVAAAGGELVAVVGLEGVATPELAAEYRRLLTTAIESDGLSLAEPDGFRLATYGQLYSLKPRLNELMIKVKPPGA